MASYWRSQPLADRLRAIRPTLVGYVFDWFWWIFESCFHSLLFSLFLPNRKANDCFRTFKIYFTQWLKIWQCSVAFSLKMMPIVIEKTLIFSKFLSFCPLFDLSYYDFQNVALLCTHSWNRIVNPYRQCCSYWFASKLVFGKWNIFFYRSIFSFWFVFCLYRFIWLF